MEHTREIFQLSQMGLVSRCKAAAASVGSFIPAACFLHLLTGALSQPGPPGYSLELSPMEEGQPWYLVATVEAPFGYPLEGFVQWRDVYLNMYDFGDSDLGRTPLMLQPTQGNMQRAVSRAQFPNLEPGGHTIYSYFQSAQEPPFSGNATSIFLRIQEQQAVQAFSGPYMRGQGK